MKSKITKKRQTCHLDNKLCKRNYITFIIERKMVYYSETHRYCYEHYSSICETQGGIKKFQNIIFILMKIDLYDILTF